MKSFDPAFTQVKTFLESKREPDFDNLLRVLKKQAPSRPTLFEFLISPAVINAFTDPADYEGAPSEISYKRLVDTYRLCGYDFASIVGCDFGFPSKRHQDAGQSSISINDGGVIIDRKSFENYDWQEPADFDYSRIDMLGAYIPDGMKLLIHGNNGVLENVIQLVGYENLCFMLYEDPELAEQIFNEVGGRLLRYYSLCVGHDCVGALVSNDDWGFNTQTMLSVEQMRKYVFPWHKKFAELAHSYGKPICLHSCGKFDAVVKDISEDIKMDGRHSYEDNILPVEEAYKKYHNEFAVLGGMDIDFLARKSPEEIYNRSVRMLEAAPTGYALGTGNSIAPYIPLENYLAMIAAAVFN